MDVADRRQLLGDGVCNFTSTVTDPANHRPPGRIEVAVAVGVDDPATFCPDSGTKAGTAMKDRASHRAVLFSCWVSSSRVWWRLPSKAPTPSGTMMAAATHRSSGIKTTIPTRSIPTRTAAGGDPRRVTSPSERRGRRNHPEQRSQQARAHRDRGPPAAGQSQEARPQPAGRHRGSTRARRQRATARPELQARQARFSIPFPRPSSSTRTARAKPRTPVIRRRSG